MTTRRALIAQIEKLEDMLSSIEGSVFGPWLVYSYHGDRLVFNYDGGWKEVSGFKDEDYLREFSDEMNAATLPIRKKLIDRLKKDIIHNCRELARLESDTPATIKNET